jgi:hypothetical protein
MKKNKSYLSAWLKEHHERQIGKDGIQLRIYQGDEYFGRVEMSDAGITVWSGRLGKKQLANLTWYQFLLLMAREGQSAARTQRYAHHG